MNNDPRPQRTGPDQRDPVDAFLRLIACEVVRGLEADALKAKREQRALGSTGAAGNGVKQRPPPRGKK